MLPVRVEEVTAAVGAPATGPVMTVTDNQLAIDAALALDDSEPSHLSLALRRQLYDHYMTEARRWAERLKDEADVSTRLLDGELGELQFFALPDSPGAKH